MGNMNNNIGFIGAGKMASAIINGMIKSDFLPCDSIFIFDTNHDVMK